MTGSTNNNRGVLKQAGCYSVQIGGVLIKVVSDGTTVMLMDKLLRNINPVELENILSRSFLKNAVVGSINNYVFELDGKVILIDTGAGDLVGADTGRLPESLADAGYSPEQIDVVLLTHIHGDHSGGLTRGEEKVFPNATIYVNKADLDFWMDEANEAEAPEGRQRSFRNARLKLGPYITAGKVQTFEGQTTLFTGLCTLPSPGHTPGHTYYVLEDNGEKLVFCADIAHVPAIQFAMPWVSILFDVNPELAMQARKRALADAAKEGYWLASSHASFPGVGHVRSEGEGYAWVPIQYSIDGTGQ